MQRFKYVCLLSVLILGLATVSACKSSAHEDSVLIKGHVKGLTATDGMISASFDGEYDNRQFYELEIDSAGNFIVDIDMPVEATELTLYKITGDQLHFYVRKGDCLDINLDWTGPEPAVEFDGELADVNRVLFAMDSVAISASSSDKYRYDYDGYMNCIKQGYDNDVRPKIEQINDPELRDYFSRLMELKHQARLYNLYGGMAMQNHTDPRDIEEYREIIDSWDPNDPVMIDAGLVTSYVESRCKNEYIHNKVSPIDFERLDIIKNNVTNPDARRVALSFYGNMFFKNKKPTREDVERYFPEFMSLASDCAPEVAKTAQAAYDKFMENLPGKKIGYDPTIETVDGKTLKLSELFGPVLYIDLWASWCGPCCAEIPHLEKLVKRFEDNDGISFISISVDEDRDKWLRKVETDKPEWPQYRLMPEDNKAFMDALGAEGIPRFVLLDSTGHFISADAPRPSDETIDDLIVKSINK